MKRLLAFLSPSRPAVWILSVLSLLASIGLYTWVSRLPDREPPEVYPRGPFPKSLSDAELQELAGLVQRTLDQPLAPFPAAGDTLLKSQSGALWIVLRRGGTPLSELWSAGGTWEQNVVVGVGQMARDLPDFDTSTVDRVELFLPTRYVPGDVAELKARQLQAGRLGLELTYGRRLDRFSPTWLVSHNFSYERVLAGFLKRQGQDPAGTSRKSTKVRLIEGFQVLVERQPDGSWQAFELTCANRPVADEVTPKELEGLLQGLQTHLLAQLDEQGRLPYVYLPGTDARGTKGEIQVRQWLASWALARLSDRQRNLVPSYRRNLSFQMSRTLRTDGSQAWIEEENREACLGGMALAGLALAEGPERARYRRVEDQLYAATLGLWQKDGSFRTFLKPLGRNQGQDFYPGEALLFWAARYEREPDAALQGRMMRSFAYYRKYHLEKRHPAFVPWQAQAAARLYAKTRDPWLKDYVFELTDWLLAMQQWGEDVPSEFKGQFFAPDHPEYGSLPHVSSTAVYLEGLASALEVARLAGDNRRMRRYEEAIRRGLRSLVQHQYRTPVDSFFAPHPEKTLGGLRSSAFDSSIRVDSLGHALNACLSLKALGIVP